MHLPKPLFFILIAVLILRIPNLFEPYWYGDEGIYLTVGEGIRHGLSLYKEIYDHKPPGIFLLAALAGSIFWFKVILLLWHLTTVGLFWKLNQILFEKRGKLVLLSTSIFALLTTLPLLEGNITNGEILMIGPVIGALVILLGTTTWQRLLLAGGLFSLSVLIKPPALLDAAALVVFWVTISVGQWKNLARAVVNAFCLVIGIAIPILLVSFYFFSKGTLPDFLKASFFQNVSYISVWSVPKLSSAGGTLEFGLLFRTVILAFAITGIFLFRKFFDKVTLFVSIWFVLAVFSMLLSGRPYPHYIIQAIPPFAILVTTLVLGNEKYRFLTVPFLLVFFTSLVFYKFYYYPVFAYYQNFLAFAAGNKTQEQYFSHFDSRVTRTYELAKFLSMTTKPDDKVFIWGTEPELYALSKRLPPGRYVTSFHIVDFGAQKETIESLVKSKPKYIIRVRGETRELPGLDNFMHQNYIYLETINEAGIWKLLSFEL